VVRNSGLVVLDDCVNHGSRNLSFSNLFNVRQVKESFVNFVSNAGVRLLRFQQEFLNDKFAPQALENFSNGCKVFFYFG